MAFNAYLSICTWIYFAPKLRLFLPRLYYRNSFCITLPVMRNTVCTPIVGFPSRSTGRHVAAKKGIVEAIHNLAIVAPFAYLESFGKLHSLKRELSAKWCFMCWSSFFHHLWWVKKVDIFNCAFCGCLGNTDGCQEASWCWNKICWEIVGLGFPICLKLLTENQLFPEIFFCATSEFEQILE